MFFLDFDRFKAVNDSLGHEAGDRLLRGIADRARTLADEVRGGRLEAFRLGGDEFVLVLHGRSIGHEIRHLADRALLLFAQPHVLDGHPCVSTASIGIATASGLSAAEDPTFIDAEGGVHAHPSIRTASELLRNADLAMMQAKAAGKARLPALRPRDVPLRAASAAPGTRPARGDRAGPARPPLRADPLRRRPRPRRRGGAAALGPRRPRPHRARRAGGGRRGVGPDPRARRLGVQRRRGGRDRLRPAGSSPRTQRNPAASRGSTSTSPGPRPRTPRSWTASARLLEGCEALSGRLCLEFDEASLGRGLRHFAGLVKRVSELGVETCIDHLGGSQSSLADLARLKIDRIKIHPGLLRRLRRGRRPGPAGPRAVAAFARGVGVEVTATGVDSRLAVATALDLRVDALQGLHFGGPIGLAEMVSRAEADARPRRAA